MDDTSNIAGPSKRVDSERTRRQLRKWQERLLDLSKSSPLLGVNRSRVSKLRIKSPDPLSLFNDLVSEERVLKLPIVRKQRHEDSGEELFGTPEDAYIEPGDVEFDASPHDLIRRLRRIHDNARTTVEERGVTTLYVTFGALHWKDQFLGDSVSPLCMVPAQLVSKGPDAPLRLSVSDEEVQLNPALVLYLRERHRINFPELPDEL